MERTRWVDRTFTFDIPTGWIPNIAERLRGTHPRLVWMTRDLDAARTCMQHDGKWSIRQHIGHLIDLDVLHEGRVDDYIAQASELRPADMTNAATEHAAHNERPLEELLERFARSRRHFVDRIVGLDEDVLSCPILHPRLQRTMRPVDMAYFVAEHDDHHLASIRSLL
ncbi:MAG: DinB family protein [Flavobacteriales bacterium]|nr:DinB family protein [Flavobacteriales bacterium]MCB9166535.1 DinB family protein [Flavobacteriales bacterium]